MVEIVDDAWAAETLPVEDVVVAPSEMTNLEEDEPAVAPDDDDDNKWTDIGIDELSCAIAMSTYNTDGESSLPTPLTH